MRGKTLIHSHLSQGMTCCVISIAGKTYHNKGASKNKTIIVHKVTQGDYVPQKRPVGPRGTRDANSHGSLRGEHYYRNSSHGGEDKADVRKIKTHLTGSVRTKRTIKVRVKRERARSRDEAPAWR